MIFAGGAVLAYYRHKRNTPPKQPPPPLQGNWEEINGLIRNVEDVLKKAMDDAVAAHDLLWLTAVKFVKEELSDLSLGIQRGSIRYEDARTRILDLKDRVDKFRNPPTTATSGGHPSIQDLAYLNLGVSRGADSYEILGVSRSASEEEVATAYKQKIQEWHPDRFRTKRGVEVSNAVSKIVNNAKDQIYRQRGWR